MTVVRGLAVAAAAALLLGWGCATTPEWMPRPPASFADTLVRGIEAYEADEFAEAATRFGWLAERCEAGPEGRRAVLLLAAVALDPRNPDAAPDEAARLAARFLELPRAGPSEAILAETLLLLALDRGAGIPSPPDTAEIRGSDPVRGVATRFHTCASDTPPEGGILARPLPELPGTPTAVLLTRLRAQRDSLSQRVTELEAELQRIRGLLQEGLPPDTGSGGP